MIVFADTSALYAVLDQADESHRQAVEVWHRLLLDETILLSTNYVLLEMNALLQSRLGTSALRAFQYDVAPLLTIDWISQRRHEIAVEAVLTSGRRKLSLVDCASFQTMRESGVCTAFCFDRHFREHGFETIP